MHIYMCVLMCTCVCVCDDLFYHCHLIFEQSLSLNLKFTNLARLGRHPSPVIHCLYFLLTRVTGVCHYTCSFILGLGIQTQIHTLVW